MNTKKIFTYIVISIVVILVFGFLILRSVNAKIYAECDAVSTAVSEFTGSVSKVQKSRFGIPSDGILTPLRDKESYCSMTFENDVSTVNGAHGRFQIALNQDLYNYFESNGWTKDDYLLADGPNSGVFGFHKDKLTVLVGFGFKDLWTDCPDNQPVSDCDLKGKTAHHELTVRLWK